MNRWPRLLALAALLTAFACQEKPHTTQARPFAPTGGGERVEPLRSDFAVQEKEEGSSEGFGLAPSFELPDLDGRKVSLADYRGKVVVLEWFNPECPFVRAAHERGSLVDAAARLQKSGVVYLAVNSAAPGKQGAGVAANRKGAAEFRLDHPILLDERGDVGRAYGATNTPHLFIIDTTGRLVYRGAVDNSPDGEGEAPTGGRLIRYMEEAVEATLAKRSVREPETQAYGCSVKYGS